MSKKRYTLDELAALERDEPMEFSFRDGYARGYQAALDDVYGLMDAGNSKKKTRKYCKKFLSEELAFWGCDDGTKMEQLPQLKVSMSSYRRLRWVMHIFHLRGFTFEW